MSIDVCINVSVFMPIPSGLYYYCTVIQLEIRDGNTSINSFFEIYLFLFFVYYFLSAYISVYHVHKVVDI